MKKLLKNILFIALYSVACTHISYAQVITTLQPMSFGTAIVTNNDIPHEINLAADGSYSADSEFVFLSPPQQGIYRLVVFPPSITNINSIFVTIDQQMQGAGEDFIIDNFDIDSAPQTSILGDLEIEIGARLRTTGSGVNYTPLATYNALMTLNIIY